MTTRTRLLHASRLAHVTSETVPELVAADRAMLILMNGGDRYSLTLCADVEGVIRDGKLDGIDVGVLDLGERDATEFANANPWARFLDGAPHVALYRDGCLVERFPAFHAVSILDHMLRLGFIPLADNGSGQTAVHAAV